jgi:hypothetical protein
MNKYAILLGSLCAALFLCSGIFAEEEPADELTAIDREIDGERRQAASAGDAAPGWGRANGVPVIKAHAQDGGQQEIEGRDSSWVKRDMNDICSKIDVFSTKQKKGRPFQFDRDDLDTSRTGKPDHIPRDAYNDNP